MARPPAVSLTRDGIWTATRTVAPKHAAAVAEEAARLEKQIYAERQAYRQRQLGTWGHSAAMPWHKITRATKPGGTLCRSKNAGNATNSAPTTSGGCH